MGGRPFFYWIQNTGHTREMKREREREREVNKKEVDKEETNEIKREVGDYTTINNVEKRGEW